MSCDARYGQFLVKKECREAVMGMPTSRQGVEVEWAVNHIGQEYTLPMTISNS